MQKVAGNTTEVADQLVESPRPGSLKFHHGGQIIHSVSPSQLGGVEYECILPQPVSEAFKNNSK